MSKIEVYADIMENGELSQEKLYELMEPHAKNADEIAENLKKEGKLIGDELADEFFNTLGEETILRFQTKTQIIELRLAGYRYEPDNSEEEQEFGGCYLIEYRNLEDQLEDGDSFELGEEKALCQELKTLLDE